nr:MAG TPA: YvrJ protein family protein [Caudoviricetes sp.]
MDLATMGSLVGTVGFPIAIALIVSYILYKVFKVMLDRFLKSLDEITLSNKILVETNASFVGNVNTKMEDIEEKVDKIMEKLG